MKSHRFLIFVVVILPQIPATCQDEEDAEKANSTAVIPTLTGSCSNCTYKKTGRLRSLEDMNFLLRISNYIILCESIIGIVTNGFLILFVCFTPFKRLREASSTVIIVNLALADLLTSWVTVFYAMPPPSHQGQIINTFLWLGYFASFFMLFLFTLERFIGAIFPFQAQTFITYRKTCFGCLASWVAAAGAVTMDNYFRANRANPLFYIAEIAFLEIVVAVMVVLNISIVLSLQKHAKKFREGKSNNGWDRKQQQLNTVLSSLILLLIITVFPYLISIQFYHAMVWCSQSSFNCLDYSVSTKVKIVALPRIILPLGVLNYVVNPIIYTWRLEEFRTSACALFSRKKPTQTTQLGKITV